MACLQLTVFLGLVALSSLMQMEAAPRPPDTKCCVKSTTRTLQFFAQYVYDDSTGVGPICVRPISGPLGTPPGLIGYAASFSCKLTQGPDYNSAQVGTTQGLVANVGDGFYATETFMLNDGTIFGSQGSVSRNTTSTFAITGVTDPNATLGGSLKTTIVQFGPGVVVTANSVTLTAITY